jgi:hypothetical protein
MTDDVTQQYTRWDSEDTLLRIRLPLVCVESRENPLEIVDQGMRLPSFYDHIINVGLDTHSRDSFGWHAGMWPPRS